jgi:hypothetical protein
MFASEVMDEAAALLNDQAKATFTYVNMLPFVSKANDELAKKLVENGISVTKQGSAVSTIAIGTAVLPIPADMIVPQRLYEKSTAEVEYDNMDEVYPLPEEPASNEFNYWSYYDLIIHLGPANGLGALTIRNVKMDYLRLITSITASGTVVEIGPSKTFLAERTAALAARFIGEDPDKADTLDIMALGPARDGEAGSLRTLVNIFVRNNQSVGVRRQGFHRRRGRR